MTKYKNSEIGKNVLTDGLDLSRVTGIHCNCHKEKLAVQL